MLNDLEALYKDVHPHAELSMQEHRTAGVAAERLKAAGFDVSEGVGKTEVIGVLRNGDGPTVMLRADMDALPVKETTGLPYASSVTATDHDGNETPVMHARGHDIHVTWLAGTCALMAAAPEAWRGTLIALFQPGEETAAGAQAMIGDGLFERFPQPEVILGQHVMPMPAGAGTKENVIPDDAVIKLNVRTFDESVRKRLLTSIERIVKAEAEASGASRPPEITPPDGYDPVRNDATGRVRDALQAHFDDGRVTHSGPASASEDFGCFAVQWHVPSVFWLVGGINPTIYAQAEREGRLSELPTNHDPELAPVIHPMLETGVEALVTAACAWLTA